MRRDPISLGIGAISLFEGITGVAIGFEAAGLVGGTLLVGGAVALNYAAQALQNRGQGSAAITAPLNDNSIKYNERQAIPRKRIIYGTAQVGGALFFEQAKAPYLYHGFLICAEQVTAFRRMWVGSNELFFSDIQPNSILTPIAVDGTPDYRNNLKVSFRVGLPSQTLDGLLHQDFTNLDASFRQQGIATVVVRYNYGANYDAFTKLWGQVQKPNPLWLVDGIAIPDPRKAGHILNWDPDDPDSVAEARASWEFSNNASLVEAHFLTQRYGGRYRPSSVDWDKVADSANFDDDLIYCNDGTYQRRYTIDGVVNLSQQQADMVSGFIAANRGYILNSAGKVWPSSARPRKPLATIHDGILTGPVSIRASKPKRDLLNRLKIRYVDPNQDYQQVDGPVIDRPDLQALDGEILEGTLDLPCTLDIRRAERLGKAYLEAGRLGKLITARVDVRFLANLDDELIGSCVTWDSKLFSQGNGQYLVSEWGFADRFSSIDVSLLEYNPTIETDWIASRDEIASSVVDLNVS